MCVSKLAERSVVQATYQQGVLVDQPISGALGISRDGDIPDGFRRSDPDAGSREAEAVAGETEFGDMTAAIGQQFADPHRAGEHPVPAIRGIAFGIDRLIPGKAATASDLLQGQEYIKAAGTSAG